MKHEVKLPYPLNALEPHISRETLEYHFGKHHKAYVKNLNNLIKGTRFEKMSLEQIIEKSSGGLYNNAAQVWNHSFYWESLTGDEQGKPTGKLATAIKKKYGSLAKMKKAFNDSAGGNFGSGWTWLVKKPRGGLDIINTSNAECVITENVSPILVCDVWEHAYYIDTRNNRGAYLKNFWQLVDWKKVSENYEG